MNAWYYIPTKFLRPGLAAPRRVGANNKTVIYPDNQDPLNEENSIVFLPKDQAEIDITLKTFDLTRVKWRKAANGNYVVVEATLLPMRAIRQKTSDMIALYTEARSVALKAERDGLKKAKQTQERYAKDYLAHLTNTYAEIEKLDQQLETDPTATLSAKVARELRSLKALTTIDRFWIEETNLKVHTKPLSAAGVTFGSFIISISIGTGLLVLITNESPIGGRASPHITTNGDVCWGNVGPMIAKLQANKDIVGLVNTVIEFIQSYDPKSMNAGYNAIFDRFKTRQEKEAEKPKAAPIKRSRPKNIAKPENTAKNGAAPPEKIKFEIPDITGGFAEIHVEDRINRRLEGVAI